MNAMGDCKAKAKNKKQVVLEYINGDTLWNYRLKGDKQIAKLARQALNGFQYALKQNIIPRDLHLNNMMVNKAGNLKLIDMGLYENVGSRRFDFVECEEAAESLRHFVDCIKYKHQSYLDEKLAIGKSLSGKDRKVKNLQIGRAHV